MNKSLIFACVMVSTATLLPAQAQTYQWNDASGKTVISDTPPPASARDSRSLGLRQPAVVTGTPAEAATDKAAASPATPPTMAEKEMEFRKRQQESREKSEKAEKEAAAAREKRDTCERARSNYRMLQSDLPLRQAGKGGDMQVMDDGQRRQELERTRRIMQEACK